MLSIQGARADDEQWPSFRGQNALGISETKPAPTTWNLGDGTHIKWKTPIPGLGHSSPIVWNDRIYVTTASSGGKDEDLKVGLYGEGDPVEKAVEHEWKLICLDKLSGKVLWDHTAHRGVPKQKRHPKSTHANSTPATDGKYVVAFFASEGLYCYDMDGKPLWSKDLGTLQAGPYNAPTLEWGFASSPIIHEGRVVIQCDVLNGSFLATFDVKTGEEIWRTMRDENASWSTPAIYTAGGDTRIALNGYKHIGGYDFKTGKEIWWMEGGGDIPVPTPAAVGNLVYINSAHGRMAPIYAVQTAASGDIQLADRATSNDAIAWSVPRNGSYILSPLVYGDYLYNCTTNGRFFCFDRISGKQIYNERLGPTGTPFSASGVACHGRLYFTSEEGEVFVVKAGPEFEVIATNAMNEICMATPAISDGTLYFRTRHELIAIAE